MRAHIRSLLPSLALAIVLLGTIYIVLLGNGFEYGYGIGYVGTQAEAEYNEGGYHL
ncbi:unnamed protein product, partial [marine sediment metagenome]